MYSHFHKSYYDNYVNLYEIVVYISHYLWKQKTRSTLGVDHENFNKFLLFIFNVSISKWYAPTYTRKKYEPNKIHCNIHTLKRNWAYNHKTRDYRYMQIIVNFKCKHRATGICFLYTVEMLPLITAYFCIKE